MRPWWYPAGGLLLPSVDSDLVEEESVSSLLSSSDDAPLLRSRPLEDVALVPPPVLVGDTIVLKDTIRNVSRQHGETT